MLVFKGKVYNKLDQVYIDKKINLLDDNGKLIKAGYCEYNRYIYDREHIKFNKGKIKEWDYYQISDDTYTIHFNIFDVSYAGSFVFSVFNRKTGDVIEKCGVSLLTYGNIKMEEDTNVPHVVSFNSSDCYAKIVTGIGKRNLYAKFKSNNVDYEVDINLEYPENLQSLVMAVPFEEENYFYLNQKMNSMVASGTIKSGENVLIEFSKNNSFGVLDWGRGVWPHQVNWYWGNGNTYLSDGHIFGFEIGWGFGDMSNATENCLFYDGVAHKIEEVYLQKDDTDYMKPWVFTSNDGRFEMTMTPEFDRYTSSRVGNLIGNICHQVFGKWNGTAVLDDGTVLEIHDMLAFCEESDNLW